ncbi:hypothetical protein HLK59_34355 [Streptomyces sp. S3(2020)]|uniref:hypothetical protein n=1 Tax=Streptomyces sp. S3(2020) TaxID=2732044 RepID=UPI001489E1A0|nr:hypothetical protein [Streptomyces sp. S3(2020)]NNN35365.1 hypothetical protein [Streptomyces sp. S3(2020)]
MISQAVDATAGSVLERLKFWLQMPADSMFTKMMDNDCQVRADRVGTVLSPVATGPHDPSGLSLPAGLEAKWAAVDQAVKANRAVVIKGSTGHVGGNASKFTTSFHVIVFLAVSQVGSERRYYLSFDPDVSATAESREKWKPLVLGSTEAKTQKFTDAKSVEVIKAMILGDSQDGFGPLVRKYYVETDKAFPQIVHA